ncbi:NF-X1-type zinc finger protein NFXL1 [Silene latifolia]|uniref:NF-X1-type zinc finger protein NFXL1 n=1 Tax=Silene latifolia TaxID=37657 RepID=UPI003D789F63
MSFQTQDEVRDQSRFRGQNAPQRWVARGAGIVGASPGNIGENHHSGNGGNGRGRPGRMNRGGRGSYRGGGGGQQSGFNAYRPSGNSGVDGNVRPVQVDGGNGGHRGFTSVPVSQFNEYGSGGNGRPMQTDRGNRGHRGSGYGGRSYVGRPQDFRRDRVEAGYWGSKDKDRGNWKKGEKVVDSDLPQLVQEIQEKLTKGTVECMICYDMVRRTAPIWSCSSCYSIFHLNCIKKWARAPTSIDTSAEKSQGFNWRCPGCQSVQLTASKEIHYVCFCGKRHDPSSDLYLTPHSCGEPCGKPLEREVPGADLSKDDICPHVCVLQCHPGPCPPCKAFAPPRPCPCGKEVITTRCSERKSVNTCGHICDKLLGCGRHRCDRICHLGPCEPCGVLLDASCFCKKKSERVLCGDLTLKGDINADEGLFPCASTCEKKLKCGNHNCADACHPGPCGECELLPSKVKTCYCGKTPLRERRKSCLDPIPTCSGVCGKVLPCGVHMCKDTCHSGDCSPCLELVAQKCRCGSTSRSVECYKTTLAEEKFVCDRSCGRKKNCGRHRCSERCCPLSGTNNTVSGDWNPHFCSMPCGKKLRCGQHACESFCHSGHCPPCLETIFADLTCACGRTSLPPPLPCGTPTPSCQYPCSVPQPCGHEATHSCHFGDCPPCSIPIAKECIGGHVVLRNIPCGSKDIRCNKICGKTRRCGLHACSRSCHPAPCDPSSPPLDSGLKGSCGQTCGAPRRDCRHTCVAPCHPSAPCPDVRCESRVTITCSCGRISATVPCDAGGSTIGNGDTLFEASIIQKLPASLQPLEASERRVPLGQRKLMCDDECSKVERKRVLADAFDITQPSLEGLNFGDNPAVSQVVGELLRRDAKWVLSVEERCKQLVLGKSRVNPSTMKVHVFCPMLKEKRDAVRLIAERWKLSVSSAGWEPKRFIVIHATPKSKPPQRILTPKGSIGVSAYHSPSFDPLVDMDPRLVVALLDLPSDADISTLILRFGGECELVWLNDKNALAVFSDPARAATAMRRLDNGSVYHGASSVQQTSAAGIAGSGASVWGGSGAGTSGLKGNPWKKAVTKEGNWVDDSWGEEEWSGETGDAGGSKWKGREVPITATGNRWTVLNSASSTSSSGQASVTVGAVNPVKHPSSELPSGSGTPPTSTVQPLGSPADSAEEVADDWENAFE